MGRCWQAGTVAGRSQGKDSGSPKGKAEGGCLRPSSGDAHLTPVPLQGSSQSSKESEQIISTSTLIFYLSNSKPPESASPGSPTPWVPWGLGRHVEHRASCPAGQCGASCYHGNKETAASPCRLSDVSQAGQPHLPAHLASTHQVWPLWETWPWEESGKRKYSWGHPRREDVRRDDQRDRGI